MGQSYLADIPNNHFHARLGSYAAVASGGAGSLQLDSIFIAPANLKLLSAWRVVNANEVTAGTAVSSASYRRFQLCNGGASGTATTIMASLNATASAAASTTRAFAVATVTAAAGDIIYGSHLTVGAATADGTDMAAGFIQLAYQLL